MKQVLVVLEAGDRWPSGVVRGLAYRDLLANHGFSSTFVSRQPLRVMDWIDNSPFVLRRIVGRPSVRNRLVNVATRANEKRILNFARDVDIVYLVKAISYPLLQTLRRETKARVCVRHCGCLVAAELAAY